MFDPLKIQGITAEELERALTGQEPAKSPALPPEPPPDPSSESTPTAVPDADEEIANYGGDNAELHE